MEDVASPQIHEYRSGSHPYAAVFGVTSGSRDKDYLLTLAQSAAHAANLLLEDEDQFRVVDNINFAALPGFNMGS